MAINHNKIFNKNCDLIRLSIWIIIWLSFIHCHSHSQSANSSSYNKSKTLMTTVHTSLHLPHWRHSSAVGILPIKCFISWWIILALKSTIHLRISILKVLGNNTYHSSLIRVSNGCIHRHCLLSDERILRNSDHLMVHLQLLSTLNQTRFHSLDLEMFNHSYFEILSIDTRICSAF